MVLMIMMIIIKIDLLIKNIDQKRSNVFNNNDDDDRSIDRTIDDGKKMSNVCLWFLPLYKKMMKNI